jgi:hypothetical protein
MMTRINRILNLLNGLIDAVARFPISAAFLIIAVVINSYAIENTTFDSFKYLMVLCLGTLIAASLQMAYEHFFKKSYIRWVFMLVLILISIVYYFIISDIQNINLVLGIKTSVAVFAILIFFIWVPSIKSKITFNQSFFIATKAFFIALLFSTVMFIGVSLILKAINALLFVVDENLTIHAANIIFILFGIMYFLSLTPRYPAVDEDEKTINVKCPKFFEILISYIVIPLTGVFTVILILYILINLRGSFFENNLLEPMLVSYSVTVILIYILSSTLDKKIVLFFRKVFPKVLVPIVLFQTIASILRANEVGITHGRYYVVLYGIFAIIAGVLFSLNNVKYNGIIAPVLIVLSIISLVPMIDAFTIARKSQISVLENTLIENGMLEDGKIKANSTISDNDKLKITSSYSYLRQMNYTKDVEWLKAYNDYNNFKNIFGFEEFIIYNTTGNYYFITTKDNVSTNIEGYDYFTFVNFEIQNNSSSKNELGSFTKDGSKYYLVQEINDGSCNINLLDSNKDNILSFNIDQIKDKFKNYNTGEANVTSEELTFVDSNQKAEIKIIARDININIESKSSNWGANILIFIDVK